MPAISKEGQKYFCFISKFILIFIEIAIVKSLGVLLPEMTVIFSSNARTLGFINSLPLTCLCFTCPLVAYMLKSGKVSSRLLAVIGALISSMSIILAGFVSSVTALGFCLAMTGISLSTSVLSSRILLNKHFKDRFVIMSAIANIGSVVGGLAVPVIIERALEAYGYSGAMLLLGGITFHALPASMLLSEPNVQSTESNGARREEPRNEEETQTFTSNDFDDACASNSPEELTPILNKTNKTSSDEEEIQTFTSNDLIDACASNTPEDLTIQNETKKASPDEGLGEVGDTNVRSSVLKKIQQWMRSSIFFDEPVFLVGALSIFLVSCGMNSWFLFLVPKAEWRGIPSSQAAFLATLGATGGVMARACFITMLYFEVNPVVLCGTYSTLSALTFFIDPLLSTFSAMCGVAFLQGWSIFSCASTVPAFLKYSVADRNFAVASGFAYLVEGVGGSFGAFLSGLIKDMSGSYTITFVFLGAVFCVTTVNTMIFLVALRKVKDLTSTLP